MSELVNEYDPENIGSSEKTHQHHNPINPDHSPQADSHLSSSGTIDSNDQPFPTRAVNKREKIPEIDNPPLDLILEQELVEGLTGPSNEMAVHDALHDPASVERMENAAQQFEQACIDLIKETRTEQSLAPEDFDQDLADVLSKIQADTEYSGEPDYNYATVPAASDNYESEVPAYQHEAVSNPGFWSWKAALGSVLVVIAMVATGGYFSTSQLPGVVATISTKLAPQQPDPTPGTTIVNAQPATTSVLTPANTGTELLPHGAEFTNAPVPKVMVVENWQGGVADRMQLPVVAEQQSADHSIEVESLNVKLDVMKSHLGSLNLAQDIASPEKMPKLLEETARTRIEISSLEDKISVLVPEPVSSLMANVEGLSSFVEPEAASANSNTPGGAAASAISRLTTPVNPVLTAPATSVNGRDPQSVELALAATPGLYSLDLSRRDLLKNKLVKGECLVPALSSVYPRVPALVMRDLVRQLGVQC